MRYDLRRVRMRREKRNVRTAKQKDEQWVAGSVCHLSVGQRVKRTQTRKKVKVGLQLPAFGEAG